MNDQKIEGVQNVKFSLIVGTLNRAVELDNCLKSLQKQEYTNYEIIIIDQSENDETEKLIKSKSQEMIKYYHVSYKGLSRARNDGLKKAKGDYICLIDDDAFYRKDFLSTAVKSLDDRTVLSGYIYDTIKKGAFVKYNVDNNYKKLSLRSIIRTCPSAGLVIPMRMIKDVGGFDEQLGVGSDYPSGEETDLLLRGLRRGYTVVFIKDLILKHPYPIPDCSIQNYNANEKRALYYKGLGALFKKHLFINKMHGLLVCYLEVWIKLLIKKILFFKYGSKQIKKQMACLKEGVKRYLPVKEVDRDE